jgi:RimJ/RimL family protein N-acetyltransferase
MVSAPTLETNRLLLRPWRAEDCQPFSEMSADPELMRYVGGVMDRIAAWRRMAAYAGHWSLRGYGRWALEVKATGRFVGYSGGFAPDGWPEPEINWGLGRAHFGRGFSTEAATRARAYAYDVLGFMKIASCIDLENKPSIAVAKRLGAKFDREIIFFDRPGGVFRHFAPGDRSKVST